MHWKNDRTHFSTLSGVMALVLWSATIALSRSLSESLGPLTAATAVYLVGGFFCLLRLFMSGISLRQLFRIPGNYLIGCGFLFILYTVLLYLAVGLARDRDQALEIGLINYLWPALTLLLSLALLKQQARWWLWPGTAIALMGIFLVMTQGAIISWSAFWGRLHSNPLAYILAFVAAISWALYSNLTRRWAGTGNGGAVELFIPATGFILFSIRLFVTEPTSWNPRATAEMVILGAITALAYALWDVSMRRGNLLLVAACSYFTPLLSTLVSCIYWRVMPGSRLWIGSLMIVVGSLMSWRAVADKESGNERFGPAGEISPSQEPATERSSNRCTPS